MSQLKQQAICVLGMHRSGTSAIARALNLLGAYIGPSEKLLPPQEDNPEGFWEHETIVDFHLRILRTLNRSWYSVTPLPDRWWQRPEIEPYRQELADLIRREFGGQRLWMWKDPRTALVLPLWIEVLQQLEIEPYYVICLRHPLDVAASLHRRDGFSIERSLVLWQFYNLSALYWTATAPRCVVSYDRLLEDWESCLTTLMNTLAINWPSSAAEQREALAAFLQPQLRHSCSDLAALAATDNAGTNVTRIYRLLTEGEQNPAVLHSADYITQIARAYREYYEYTTLFVPEPDGIWRESTRRPVLEAFWPVQGEFSQERSASVDVHVDREVHTYELAIPLPIEGLLRLDPLNFPASVEIGLIELVVEQPASSAWTVLRSWGSDDGFRDLVAGPEVILLSDQSEGLHFVSLSSDSQLFLYNVLALENSEDAMTAVLRVDMRIKSVISQDVAETLIQWRETQHALEASMRVALELKDNHIRNLEAGAQQKDNHIRNLEAGAQQKDNHIRNLEAGAQQKDNHIRNLEAGAQQKDNHIRNLEAGAQQKDVLIEDLQRQRHSQEEVIAHHAQHIEKIEEENLGHRALIAKLKIETTTLLQQLGETKRVKETLEQSLSWRLTAPFRLFAAVLRYIWKFIRWPRLHRLRLELGQELIVENDGFRSTGDDPYFFLYSSRARMPTGWVIMTYRVKSPERGLQPSLYIDTGAGFSEHQKLVLRRPIRVSSLSAMTKSTEAGSTPALSAKMDSMLQFLFCMPNSVLRLRLDPLASPGQFTLFEVTIREISVLLALVKILEYHLKPLLWRPGRLIRLIQGFLGTVRTEGMAVARRRFLLQEHTRSSDYVQWVKFYDTLMDDDRTRIRHHIGRLSSKPLISIVMPTYNTPEEWLVSAIESVCQQLYPHWELCIADDASTNPQVRAVLEQYQQKDPRIKVVYRERNGHISAASNSALELATGEFIAFLDHDDVLTEHALYMLAVEVNAHPEVDLLYSDEDKIDEEGNRYHPYFKPDWNPDLFLSQNLVTHLCVCRSRLVREINGFREGYEGAQDWDLVMRIVEQIPATHIRHLPYVLYHWRAIPGSTALGGNEKRYITEAQHKTLQSHFERIGETVEIIPTREYWHVRYPIPQPAPLVSLIIPTRNGYDLLYRSVESIYDKTRYANLEVLIVDNQSSDRRTFEYMQRLSQERGVRVLCYDAPFNFSAINNFAAQQAHGEVIGFINNDIEVITPDWLDEMVSHALRPEIGAVGAMLYYPQDTIQHAGVILGLGGVAGHIYVQYPRGHTGLGARAMLTQNISAVTAACLVVRRAIFEEIGGFDEENFAVAFNDVDFCLRLRERGYRNLWTPHAELYHWESASRGYEDTPEKQARFKGEIANAKERWGELLLCDPAYNVNLTLENLDSSLAFPPRRKAPWHS